MKKAISFLLVFVLMLSMSLCAFAATEDIVLTFSLDVDGAHSIEAAKGDRLVVTYSITADEKANTSVNQNEIQYDHTFFRLVSDSITRTEKCSHYTAKQLSDSDGSRRIYFNTGTSMVLSKDVPLVVGTFTLEVIASGGSSTVQSTSCFAQDSKCAFFGSETEDLTVTVSGGGSGEPGGGRTDDPVQSEASFLDVKAGEYYYDAVLWAADNGITQGTSDTTFSPNAPVTRAQVVTFLWRAAGCPEPAGSAGKFTDVQRGSYYEKAVAWAVGQGITNGTTDTAFSPDRVCTRGQIVTFLARFAGVKDAQTATTFTDVKPTDYFAAAVQWAKDNGVTSGTGTATFSPNQDCTRAQVVTFLYRWIVR